MRFAKLHGLGNDFLIVKAGETGRTGGPLGLLAERMCRRHTGIGADGVLCYQPTSGDAEADVSALIFNADGSRAEISGNGTRCLAAFLVHTGASAAGTIRIRTVSGIKRFALTEQFGNTYYFESSLGQPVTDPASIPVRLGSDCEGLIDYPLQVGLEQVRVTISSMGNPHCSTFWADVTQAPVETLGPLLERHECFPHRTNVEFVQILDRHRIRARFWERGVGLTLSSGTGSSAAAVAGILNGLVESPVTVEVEMGNLVVRWQPPEDLMLAGPAEYICDGEMPAEARL
jgi:diaminopimelate epimerase